jgi:hypothetical protein
VIESADTQAAKRGGLVSRPLGFTAFIAQLHERRQPELELLPFVRLDHFLDLLFYGVEVKGSRRLHRRIVYGGLRELKDAFLYHDETPEFASVSHSCTPPPRSFKLSPRTAGVRSKGSCRMFTIVGMSVVIFSPGQPHGC